MHHVTNVREDGGVPTRRSLTGPHPGLNNYGQNVQPEGEFSAPDVTASIFPRCDVMPYALVARVRNIGQAAVRPAWWWDSTRATRTWAGCCSAPA